MTEPKRAPRDVVNAVFGEELPSTTSDERDSDHREDYTDRDRWLRDNVPPHHG